MKISITSESMKCTALAGFNYLKFRKAQFLISMILLALSCFLIIHQYPFAEPDGVIFKEASFRLSSGLSFSCPAALGRYPGIEKIFLFYPPLYPALFGIWFKIVGFSLESDLTLSLLLGFLLTSCFLFHTPYSPDRIDRLWRTAMAVVIWGTTFISLNRPDTLFCIFFFLFLNQVMKNTQKNIVWILTCSMLYSACFLTSFVSSALMLLPVMFILVHQFDNKKGVWQIMTMGALTFLLSFIIWGFLIGSEQVLFRQQFLREIFKISTAASSWEKWFKTMAATQRNNFFFFYLPSFCLYVTFCLMALRQKEKFKGDLWVFGCFLFIWLFILIRAPQKGTYLIMIQTAFLIYLNFKSFSIANLFQDRNRLRIIVTMLYISFVCLSMLPTLRILLIPSTWIYEDTYAFNTQRIQTVIPKGKMVLADSRFWHKLVKDFDLRDLYFSPQSVDLADYIILGSGGSGKPNQAPQGLEKGFLRKLQNNFILKDSNFIETPNRLLGFPVSRSHWSYRCQIYVRNNYHKAMYDQA